MTLSRESLLDYLRTYPPKSSKRDISKAFGLKSQEKIVLKSLLQSLCSDGLVTKFKSHYRLDDHLPRVLVLDIISRGSDGELRARPVSRSVGSAIIISQSGKRRAVGIGDRVLARLEKHDTIYRARVMKRIAKDTKSIFGLFRPVSDGEGIVGYIESPDRKGMEYPVSRNDADAQSGDLVDARLVRSGSSIFASIEKVHCNFCDRHSISLIALHRHGIPHIFSPAVLSEADGLNSGSLGEREDWRDLSLITIDPIDARDHDDAVHATIDSDGTTIVTVAIADVAHYVRAGGHLDREAFHRGHSVYFPDRVIPMLPERLSTDLCSLREGEDRPALAVVMRFDSRGRLSGFRFHRILMRSQASLSYDRAQRILDGEEPDNHLFPILSSLCDAYNVLSVDRCSRSPLDLELSERKLILNDSGLIERIFVPSRLLVHRLIEEFMIQANVCAARFLSERIKSGDIVYRVHEPPSSDKLESLRHILRSLSISLVRGGSIRSHHFNSILSKVRGTGTSDLVNQLILRCQSQAAYSCDGRVGHFGLNLRHYTHFTSPIRRYSDLLVHRALIDCHHWSDTPSPPIDLPAACDQISQHERRAMSAERETIDRLISRHLSDKVGMEFSATISGVTKSGLFVSLSESGADGFIPMSRLPDDDYYIYVEARHCVYGERTKRMYQLGDSVEVRLIEATPISGGLLLDMLSEGKKLNFSLRSRLRPQPRRRARGFKRKRF